MANTKEYFLLCYFVLLTTVRELCLPELCLSSLPDCCQDCQLGHGGKHHCDGGGEIGFKNLTNWLGLINKSNQLTGSNLQLLLNNFLLPSDNDVYLCIQAQCSMIICAWLVNSEYQTCSQLPTVPTTNDNHLQPVIQNYTRNAWQLLGAVQQLQAAFYCVFWTSNSDEIKSLGTFHKLWLIVLFKLSKR